MLKDGLLRRLEDSRAFFERSTDCLTEPDSGFKPKDEMYSAASHVAHAAQTVDWFMDGMFNPKGFDLDFEKHVQQAVACKSLSDARAWFRRAFDAAADIIGSKSEDELRAQIAEGPIMGGAPRHAAIWAISEHTAHHRGALSVYSRLLGYQPKMPYGEM